MKIFLLLLATTASLFACFVPPAENVLLFRRDSLPLDSNRQKLLSRDLVTLATRATAIDSPANRRASAQLLALASNFDPEAKKPLNLSQIFAKGDTEGMLYDHNLTGPLQNLSAIILFLLEEKKSPERQEIAQLLLDPLATIAPDLDIVSAKPNAEESLRWKQAVAPLDHFVTPKKSLPPKPAEKKETPAPEKKMDPQKSEAPPLKQLAPFKGSIQVPLFTNSEQQNKLPVTESKIEKLQFTAQLKDHPARITPPSSHQSKALPAILNRVQSTLGKTHGMETIVRIDGRYKLSLPNLLNRSGHVVSFPMALLLEGFLSERQPIEDLIVLGNLAPDGTIKAPKISWQFLEALLQEKDKGTRRLLISHELRPLLESVLTQQEESFFFAYDIFAVHSLEEACELAFQDAASEETSQALAKFEEIRSVGAGKTTSVFVTNPHVLNRLEEVTSLEPRLLSASFLKMRGNNQHSTKHSSERLAALIQSALMPMAKIPYTNSRDLKALTLEEIHSQCRARLDPLSRYVTRTDSEMYDNALDIANRIRTLARAQERFAENGSTTEDFFLSTHLATKKEYFALATDTARILGQEPPEDPLTKQN